MKISDKDVDETALEYSRERVDDLVNQNQDFFTGLDHIVRSFSKQGTFEFTSEDVFKLLSNALGVGRVSINGKTIRNDDEDTIFIDRKSTRLNSSH